MIRKNEIERRLLELSFIEDKDIVDIEEEKRLEAELLEILKQEKDLESK